MIKEGKIGLAEAICLTTITISNKIFFTSPSALVKIVGTAGWYAALISAAVTIIAFAFIYMLLKRFPGKSIIEIFYITLGPVVGFVFSFTYAASFLVGCSILLREFIDVLNTYIFQSIDPKFLITALVSAAAISAFLGLESIARFAKLSAYAVLLGYMLLLILSIQNWNIAYISPVFGYGLKNTVISSLGRSSAYSEIIVISVFANALQGAEHIKKAGFISLILSGFFVSSAVLCVSFTFPYSIVQEIAAPVYEITRLIKYGSFVQRLDPLFIFLWNITTFITIAVLFYCIVSCYCKTFRMQETKPVIIPSAVLLFTTAMIPKDFNSVITKYIEILRIYAIPVFYIMPFIALMAAIFRKKKGAYK
ncbi:spore germination protein B2 [Oxobacter pfennigii]|uniref:Spore germination protein B2 n=1 Tax=Oxobacter pfennigii TaxID=36849 RepID=A0A0P8WA10_9CLOT|nr:endospore germination permease [Oxobacter pfennigii]KPU44803.1 spore germination protein B2 [Oxobacter pfennigii]